MGGPGKLISPMVSGKPLDTEIELVEDVTTAGIVLTRTPWAPRAIVERIMVEKVSGDCTLFDVEIYDKKNSPATLNLLYKRTGLTTLLDDNDNPFKFMNQEGHGADEIYVKIIPNSGTNNNFNTRILGSELEFMKG